MALATASSAASAGAASRTYNFDADFDAGVLVGVNHNAPNANQLQLNVTGTSFPVLWIANAGEDTLSKIDSKQLGASPGRELARYRTWFDSGTHAHDAWSGPAPSRTAVDKDGNAYVLNRWFGGFPMLFKIPARWPSRPWRWRRCWRGADDFPRCGQVCPALRSPLQSSARTGNCSGVPRSGVIPEAGMGRASRYPCISSQPNVRSVSSCSMVSTPSATRCSSKPRAMPTMAWMMEGQPSAPRSRTKLWSIFNVCSGKRRR